MLGTGVTWVSELELAREEGREGLVGIESHWLLSWPETEWDPAEMGSGPESRFTADSRSCLASGIKALAAEALLPTSPGPLAALELSLKVLGESLSCSGGKELL